MKLHAETVFEAVRKASQHERDFPTHGTNCACMDGLIQAVRRATSDPYQPGQNRIDYMLRAATRNRPLEPL